LHRFPGEQFDVSFLRHSLCSGEVGGERLDLRKGHIVQAMPIAELECAQTRSPE
jgi:hypothetical protein